MQFEPMMSKFWIFDLRDWFTYTLLGAVYKMEELIPYYFSFNIA
jgi:hypothetical protein